MQGSAASGRAYSLALYSVMLYIECMDTAPVKIIDAAQYGKPGYYAAVGPRALLAEAHASRTPVEITTGTATGDRVELLDYNPADPGHAGPYGELKHWIAERGPYTGQEIGVFLVNTVVKSCLDQAPILAAHIAKRRGQALATFNAAEARAQAEEAELSKPGE